MSKIIAIIPVRKFDKYLQGKNLLPFKDSNLMVHKIRQLKGVSGISEIIVSSEDEEHLRIARDEGVTAKLRPVEYADENADFGDFVSYIASDIDCKHILWASVTSPMVEQNNYEAAIKKYLEVIDNGYDSLISVTVVKRFLLDENGPFNFRFHKNTRTNNKIPILYQFTNGIVLAPRASMIEWKYNWGHVPFKYIIAPTKTIDICNLEDYKLAKILATYEHLLKSK
jgi:pseudaminic acid cytidylyltransferase